MPFIQRVVEPIYLSRQSLYKEDGEALVKDYELEAVTNNSLSNALRQLASLVLIANDIFDDLAKQLQDVCARSNKLRTRINVLEENVLSFDPKKVTVPESDICSFSLRTEHFASRQEPSTALFVATTRPDAVRRLYAAAARTPVHVMRQMDRHRHDGRRSSRFFTCTPVLGAKRRHPRLGAKTRDAISNIDIETHMPAAVVALRRWTSAEALGDVTVTPDCVVQRRDDALPLDETDHRLPSPEEQLATVALRFPAEVVPVDVSGKAFQRMSLLRRSQGGGGVGAAQQGDARTRRKPRGRRRNTIAGTDRSEIHKALAGSSEEQTTVRSASTDLLRASSESPPDSGAATATRKALQHLNSLKQWGKVKLRLMRPGGRQAPPDAADPPPIYESVAPQQQRRQLPISTPLTGAMGVAVKLREKRNAQAAHSSSGNWSQSSESGRASLGSSSTTTTSHPPKSTTTMPNTSASSSVSEGTLTPDLSSVATRSHLANDDGETSSVYSCDTEGYYTSFHVDSGLKTLKEEETSSSSLPQTPLHSTSALSPGASLTAESEYELFGKGSTSTTTSSAGTVCTTLAAAPCPAVPERKSSLVVSAMVHEPAAESPDSGHNTSSSPVESASPQGTMGRGSECDFSESDLEGVDRIERIRVKTTINSSRIPSMCVITPPQSDDEVSLKAPTSPRPDKRSHAESPVDAVRNQLNSMLGKVKDALAAAASSRKSPAPDAVVDAGDYVTIADVRGGGGGVYRAAPLYSNAAPPLATEYVSLDDLPKPRAAAALLTSPSDSLERKKRQGARVTLDSEGKVVYSSDSLKRNKGAHTTFEPGPYVKEAGVVTPTASPLPAHRAPKANIRPVQLSNRAASPQLGKVIIRAATAMPPTGGSRPMSPQQQQQPPPPRGAYVNVQSPERCVSPRTAQEEEEGYSTGNRMRTPQPPRYISPPHPPWPQTLNRSTGPGDRVLSPPAYWTLPTRRPQEHLRNLAVDVNKSVQLQTAGNGRFNTIAASSDVNRLHKFYGAQYLNNGAYTSSHNGERQSASNVVSPSYEQFPRKQIMPQVPGRHLHMPTPASVPTVPRNNAAYFSPRDHNIQSVAQMFTSSTPTKDGNTLMDMSTNYSPIQRQTEYDRMQIPDSNSALMVNKRNTLQNKPAENPLPQQLTPKKTMTAEELFAAIHKSKKRLNIKTDFDTYSRSGSPSCSSVNSLSPGSSESSINGKRAQPEQGSFASDKNRNRHSWSPNNEDVILENMQRSYSPTVGAVGSRQSWACDRAGLPSQTSRNDFKRLLLQHGSKSSATQVSGHQGGGGGRMSAVEQLKLSRQQNTNGYHNPRVSVEKRSNGSKLLQSPRSAATWRFASPRTDVLSTTILEDCAEDEDNSTPSPKHSERNQQAGKNLDNYSVRNTLTNSNVRRPLEMSYGPGTQKPTKAEGLKKQDISAILQQYQNRSPVIRQPNEGSKNASSPSNNILNIKTTAPHAKPHSTIVLSPSNVKENLNSNQFNYPTGYSNYMNKTLTEANNTLPSTFKSPQLIMQQQRTMRMSPIQTAAERQKLNYNGSPGRPILASIETKSPMQSTLETAL